MRRIAAKADANAGPIIEALRAAGVSVTIISAPGVPDLLCGRSGQTFLLEVKREAGPKGGTSHRNLTREQEVWWSTWQGHAKVVRTPQDALEAVGLAQIAKSAENAPQTDLDALLNLRRGQR